MKRERVNSSVIISIGYANTSAILEIEFIDGNIYQYLDVPKNIYLSLMMAESQGKYFNNFVKDNFEFIRIK